MTEVQTSYDPNYAPSPKIWLAIDEEERIDLVLTFHVEQEIDLPNMQAHAICHCMVENQAAEGVFGVREAIARLTGEAEDRHEAVHAVGSVLMGYMQKVMADQPVDWNDYAAELATLRIDAWRKSFEE